MSVMPADTSKVPEVKPAAKAPANVASTTRVNVAFPFSQVKIFQPSAELSELAALVEELAGLVAQAAPGPAATDLRRRAHELAGQLH
jgi:hypothetical protein